MPASELDWSSYSRGPIHQVFGTKRKAEGGDMTVHHCDTQMSMQQLPKRVCQWSQQGLPPPAQTPAFPTQPSVTPDLCNNNNNNNNNNLVMAPGMSPSFGGPGSGMDQPQERMGDVQQEIPHRQIVHPALSHVLSQQPPRVPSPWPSHQQPGLNNQVDMDINGETYAPVADMMDESACSGMDSDCVPDPQQYTARGDSPQRSPTSAAFCRSYCGIGDSGPASGRVRCYCKPSWEGMLDMKPYVSDVY